MISPDLRHTITSHTANMNPLERKRSAQVLIKRYGITDLADIREVAYIAQVREELLVPASVQKKKEKRKEG